MVVNLTGDLRFDTRGLPEGYDPHQFYEYRHATLVESASGLESFAYKYIPWSLLKSFAFAIDPVGSFKVSPGVITRANRTKYRAPNSVLLDRYNVYSKQTLTWGQDGNYRNVQICWSPDLKYKTTTFGPSRGSKGSQQVLADTLKDTTSRTRLFGSNDGELELFKCYLHNPPRTLRKRFYSDTIMSFGPVDNSCYAVGGTQQFRQGILETEFDEIGPTGSVLFANDHGSLRSQEIQYAKALCQTHLVSMLKDYSPKKREYTFFRNLAELRDIPQSVLSLKATLGDLRNVWYSLASNPSLRHRIFDVKEAAKNIPSEYLSFHFGWKQTWKDCLDLLALPEKIARKNQLLIARSGKPTTFRVKRNFPSAQTASQSFFYDGSALEINQDLQSRIERESELRLVINATFEFPNINSPRLRYENFLERTGISPRITDVYNLIPWTWLVDWFTGFGNYVELIDNINQDKNLINWGLITCVTHGKLITEYKSQTLDVETISPLPGSPTTTINTRINRHTSIAAFECQVRMDVSTVLDVKQTSVPSSLTAYQKSIIGALLAQRTEFSRKGSFRPRS